MGNYYTDTKYTKCYSYRHCFLSRASTRYEITTWDGVRKFEDGSYAQSLEFFKNKVALAKRIEELIGDGFVEETFEIRRERMAYHQELLDKGTPEIDTYSI